MSESNQISNIQNDQTSVPLDSLVAGVQNVSTDQVMQSQQSAVLATPINTNESEKSQNYVPSSSEKKKCILVYLFFGILVMISKPKMSEFEFFHLKQSIGRWVLFLLLLIASVIFIFIPYIRLLGIFPMIVMVSFWSYFAYQVWSGQYLKDNSGFGFFAGLGNRILSLFEYNIEVS